ncbi:sugar ABC transporter substrate-binding protein [Acidisoma cellulosilytica]|uniref:Sugar ABC transporter substrate-binding protein n=1 Tax=Acidisoma cellulosilyticum TaxID=2802395 RepID=A0A964E4G6_9PROT|nr:sugar ABC transporter substrate-binding protein [Acidisoma cellulosilyticum]MCB8881446.1 sugar ABC transporter substrate-binding protein [Acidisoma cellulosilyticum]
MKARRYRCHLAAAFLFIAGGFASVPAHAAPVTLNFWAAWDPTKSDGIDGMKQIALFEQSHPDIKVNVQVIAFDALHDKLITSVVGGDAPDISWGLVEWLGELNRMGALPDLSAQMSAAPEGKALYPNALAALTIDGKLRAVPNYIGLRALLVHTDMLKKAGIAAPPKTWAELLADAPKIKAATGKPAFGIAGTGVRTPQELVMFLAQNGVKIAVPTKDGKFRNDWADNPAEIKRAAEVFAFYQSLATTGAIDPAAAGWGYDEEDSEFAQGRYAMVVDGSWMSERVAQNPKEMADLDIVPPPYNTTPATFFEVNPFYIFKGPHEAAAWQLAQFMIGREYQGAVDRDRSPRMDVTGDGIWGKSFTVLTPIGVVFPPVPLGSITQSMEDSVGRVLLKHQKPDVVAAWLGHAVNKALRQSGQLGSP